MGLDLDCRCNTRPWNQNMGLELQCTAQRWCPPHYTAPSALRPCQWISARCLLGANRVKLTCQAQELFEVPPVRLDVQKAGHDLVIDYKAGARKSGFAVQKIIGSIFPESIHHVHEAFFRVALPLPPFSTSLFQGKAEARGGACFSAGLLGLYIQERDLEWVCQVYCAMRC